MKIALTETSTAQTVDEAQHSLRQKILPLAGLAAVVLLAAALRFAEIDSLGYVNHYYAAAVKSMLQSWHNFFFAAAEPGGSVSVDKPPVGLWLQTISAYFLGVNTLGLLLPQILAGLASIVLVYHLVQRSFGKPAGLLAALALAVTPVVVATDRNNTIDSTLIFTLSLAAWAFIKATESGKLRFLLLGAALVGLAFNIKMLAAYLPVPAFFGLYLLGAREGLWRKIGKLTLAGLLMLFVSFSWAIAVDLTPASQRPYVGSSGDNSELSLIIGYNGLERLLGMNRNRTMSAAGTSSVADSPQPFSRQNGPTANPGENPLGNRPPNNGQAPPSRPQPGDGGVPGSNNRPSGGGGRAPSDIGQAGPFRLFVTPLSKETGWFLPLALAGAALLLARTRLEWPLDPKHRALALWGGWLLVGGIFFSVASFFHEYYLSLLGAPLACLAGIGLVELWQMRKTRPLFSLLLVSALAGGTMAFQISIARSYLTDIDWLPLLFGVFLIGAILLMVAARSQTSRILALAGFTLIVFAMYILPAVWSVYTAQYPGSNLSLPAAYAGAESQPDNRGEARVNQQLLDFLQANTQGIPYLMAVPSSMQGADYVLATSRPVLYMGGFNGSDSVVTADELALIVANGELRYIYLSGGNGANSGISSWVTSACARIEGFESTTRNFGAPDGTTIGGAPTQAGTGNNQSINLYDCQND
jgi:4-amino-4-deoxy-L-arabinose transferase-like glycosyltransferase